MKAAVTKQAGQQTAEFALLMGAVVLAAFSMQLLATRAIQGGVRQVSDVVLGSPPDRSDEGAVEALEITEDQTFTERGTADFRRRTESSISSIGHLEVVR